MDTTALQAIAEQVPLDAFVWLGIGFCIVQSGLFSGLNLALLGLSRLQLEVEAKAGAEEARRILELRKDSNFLLTTILWGNVSVNCLLTLLSDSVMAGVVAFLFSTVGITLFGEIAPQAYISRNAMRIGSALIPFIRLYQKILYPVAKPTALVLDSWLGEEEVSYFRERELREVIKHHMEAQNADLQRTEGRGVLNFLLLDDLPVAEEGEPIDPKSILSLPLAVDLPIFPDFDSEPGDAFVRSIEASGRKWVVITDTENHPRLILDADAFLREVMFAEAPIDPYPFCHRPLVVEDASTPLGSVMRKLTVEPESQQDDVIDCDVILVWGEEPRIITGADLLGRLMRGIARKRERSAAARARRILEDT